MDLCVLPSRHHLSFLSPIFIELYIFIMVSGQAPLHAVELLTMGLGQTPLHAVELLAVFLD